MEIRTILEEILSLIFIFSFCYLRLSSRKKLAYLQFAGIIQPLIEKGKLEIPRQQYIDEIKADTIKKLIKPILRELNIKFLIKYDEYEITIFLTEKERLKLKKEVEKLESNFSPST